MNTHFTNRINVSDGRVEPSSPVRHLTALKTSTNVSCMATKQFQSPCLKVPDSVSTDMRTRRIRRGSFKNLRGRNSNLSLDGSSGSASSSASNNAPFSSPRTNHQRHATFSGIINVGSLPFIDRQSSLSPMRGDSVTMSKRADVIKTAQRSSGRAVKGLLAKVESICQMDGGNEGDSCCKSKQQQQQPRPQEVPVQELSTLANWSKDSYYVVVMNKNRAIPITMNAMKSFPDCFNFQAICCQVITNLSCPNHDSFRKHHEASKDETTLRQRLQVAKQIMISMNNHPSSANVQSSGNRALINIVDSMLMNENGESEDATSTRTKSSVSKMIELLEEFPHVALSNELESLLDILDGPNNATEED